ncbi:MAG: DNA topoisomerase VI subunit B [Deltaproteobacteria bacterium]|nr:DNA topoisomerase VI subunit B [Deltaproteobacteria bacterium]
MATRAKAKSRTGTKSKKKKAARAKTAKKSKQPKKKPKKSKKKKAKKASKPKKKSTASKPGKKKSARASARARKKPAKKSRSRSGAAPKKSAKRAKPTERTASELALQQRDISISEFFAKNRHLLGFDNPSKALLTTVKEGVDNALDACEEAGVLPDIRVEITQLAETRFRIAIQDNGPGIVRKQVPKIFGRLLYGSKFHRLRQSRGQQGIGISAAGMYGLMTTGKPVAIRTSTGKRKEAHRFELIIDTQKNEPRVTVDKVIDWDVDRGTRVEIELEGNYRGGQHSVDSYIRQISLANPHAKLTYVPPKAEAFGELHEFPRVSKELPPETAEVKPHPYGVELGVLMQMFRDTKARNVRTCLQGDFARVSARTAEGICKLAEVKPSKRARDLSRDEADRIHKAIQKTKIMNPSTDCIAPIGAELIENALRAEVEADYYATVTRRPSVYRGNPFLVEVGMAYGGSMPADQTVTLYRYANRVPLQYQQGGCAITKAVIGTDWRNYQLQQPRGALPVGPALLMVHIASVWVPFNSESKEAIAHYPEIIKELRLALQECGRKIAIHIRKRRREADEEKKRAYIERYIPQLAIGLEQILGLSERQTNEVTRKLGGVLERSRKL